MSECSTRSAVWPPTLDDVADFDEVQIDFYRANGDKRIKYLQIKLKHVLVSSVTPTVSEEGVPLEGFGLKYAAVEWTYNHQHLILLQYF